MLFGECSDVSTLKKVEPELHGGIIHPLWPGNVLGGAGKCFRGERGLGRLVEHVRIELGMGTHFSPLRLSRQISKMPDEKNQMR